MVELVQVIPSAVQHCPTMSNTLCFNTRFMNYKYDTHIHKCSQSQTPAFTKCYMCSHQGISHLPASSSKVLTSAMVSVHGTSLPATFRVRKDLLERYSELQGLVWDCGNSAVLQASTDLNCEVSGVKSLRTWGEIMGLLFFLHRTFSIVLDVRGTSRNSLLFISSSAVRHEGSCQVFLGRLLLRSPSQGGSRSNRTSVE